MPVKGLATMMMMTVKYKAVDDRKWILNIVLHFCHSFTIITRTSQIFVHKQHTDYTHTTKIWIKYIPQKLAENNLLPKHEVYTDTHLHHKIMQFLCEHITFR